MHIHYYKSNLRKNTDAFLLHLEYKNEVPLTVREDQAWDHLREVNVHRSMEPDEMHPRVLEKLADEVTKPLSITFEKLLQTGEVPNDGKGQPLLPILER